MHTNYVDARSLMADAKFYEAYSRYNEDLGRYETWEESVDRVMSMHREFYKDKMNDQLDLLINEATSAYKEKLVLGSQRALQFGGDQLLKNHARQYNCFSRDTRFVTSTGVKSFNDFEHGDHVVVKSHKNQWRNAVVRKYGVQKLNKVTFKRKGNIKEVMVTPDHRWLLRDGQITTSLEVGNQLVEFEDTSFHEFNWDNSTPLEKLYWCYGLVYGDGTITYDSRGTGYSVIRLCGHDAQYSYRFEEMGFKTSTNASLQGDFFAYTGKYQKTLPDIEIDGVDLVRAFVRGFLDADGEKDSQNPIERVKLFVGIQQSLTSKTGRGFQSYEFIRDIFPVVGAWVISENIFDVTTNLGTNTSVKFRINDNLKTYGGQGYWNVINIESTDIEEEVWCLEVEEDQSFILEGGIPTGNCASTYIDRPRAFAETFWMLLAGCGVGFSVQKHHIAKLPKIAERKKSAKTFVVEDSVEGWSDSLDVLLSSFFVGGGTRPEYEGRRVFFDTSLIRKKGSLISGGFKAPGPEPLRKALDLVEHLIMGIILSGGDTLRPIDAYDILMYVADAVLSGGVRRSATICLFSYDDMEMMNAKTGNWFIENPQRGRSNNSVMVLRSTATPEMFKDIFKRTKEFGEPGFIFTDSLEFTFNPCVEISKLPVDETTGESGFQVCNLSEINGATIDSLEKLKRACRAASILGTLQAGYSNLKYLTEASRRIIEREALLGVSITGWMASPDILFDDENLRYGAGIVKEVNKEVAELIGINQAARTTCVKPSGNASVLLMGPSGIHGEPSPRYLRFVQMNKEQEVGQLIRQVNPYMVEESVWSSTGSDYSIAFPVIASPNSIFTNQLKGVNLLERVKQVQSTWIEEGTNVDLCIDPRLRHNVSNTVTVANDNWDEVGDYLFENMKHFAGVSFLADSGDKDYFQAPFTSVLTPEEIVETYGTGGIFGAGLVVDALKVFPNLWNAITVANDPSNQCQEDLDNQGEWIRKFHKFTRNYFDGDSRRAEYCLKDLYIAHKWEKIQQTFKPVDFTNELKERKYTEIDTMGAIACSGGACEIVF